MEKQCSKCNNYRSLNEYHTDNSRRDGKTAQCIYCRRKSSLKWSKTSNAKTSHMLREREARKRDPKSYMIYNIRKRAAKNNLPFDLTKEDLVIPKKCPVLGIDLEFGNNGSYGFSDTSPSVDRLIPEKGYTKDNIRIISWRANRIKFDSSYEELVAVVKYLEKELKIIPT